MLKRPIINGEPELPELDEIKGEIAKLPNQEEVAKYIASCCLNLLQIQQNHLVTEIDTEIQAGNMNSDIYRLASSRLSFVQRTKFKIVNENTSKYDSQEDLTDYILYLLQSLYEGNNEFSQRYWLHHHLAYPTDFGELGISLHLYIKEFAKHASNNQILVKQTSHDHWHVSPKQESPKLETPKHENRRYGGIFDRTPAEIEAASRMPDLQRVQTEGAMLSGNELSVFIFRTCNQLLIENEKYLVNALKGESKEEAGLSQNDYQHARKIREIRLKLVREALREMKTIAMRERTFESIADIALRRLNCLYQDNLSSTVEYKQKNSVDCEMGLGKLSTALHFYITELAKLSGNEPVLKLQQVYDHNHIQATTSAPQNQR